MKPEEVKTAIDEAERFLAKAKKALKRIQNDEMAQMLGCKETGSLRRASLDLTRALADMRKPS